MFIGSGEKQPLAN